MYTKEKEFINSALDEWGASCIQDGVDKYVVLTYKKDIILKSFLELSKHDVIFGKIVLIWKNSSIDYRFEPNEPYKIFKRIKFKDTAGVNQKYFLLYLPCLNKYCIHTSNNPLLFSTAKEAEKTIIKYETMDKFDRDYRYGITRKNA